MTRKIATAAPLAAAVLPILALAASLLMASAASAQTTAPAPPPKSGPVSGPESGPDVLIPAGPSPAPARHMAIGADLFASTDADDTDVIKAGVSFDWMHDNPDRYLGIRLETAHFKPLGQTSTDDQRVYLRFADTHGPWKWNGQIGSDGDTVLGAFSLHKENRFHPEAFIEREIIETPIGVNQGLYYTFVGGAVDLPINDHNNLTFVAGVQDFTGDDVRTHLRINYVHVLKPEWGLSAQIRTRYFHSSDPGEFDYFSPRWYAEILPVIQIRRYSGGWRYVVAAGLGAQRNAGADWRSSRYFNAQITSPPIANTLGRNWAVTAAFTYSNTPVGSGNTYDYNQLTLGLTHAF